MITSSSASCAGEMESDVKGISPAEDAENFLTTTITKKGRFEMTDLTKFFEALSERAYKENDLSDVTYALCESDSCFRQFFINFFFKNHHPKIDASKVVITREFSTEWGRPDFYIRDNDNNGTIFIVEVKIWDGSHHFEPYYDILAGQQTEGQKKEEVKRSDNYVWQRLGYIANYDAVKKVPVSVDGKTQEAEAVCARVATWKEFVEELELYSCFNDSAIQAYLKYVKNVCPFDDFKIEDGYEIDPGIFIKVKKFNVAIEGAIRECDRVELYTGSSRYFISQYRMGKFFKWDWKFENGKKETQYGWIGAYYTKDGYYVCVEFENKAGWGDKICEMHKAKLCNGVLRIYIDNPRNDVDAKVFLKQGLVNTLNLLSCKENTATTGVGFSRQENSDRKNLHGLLSMKQLPFILEHYFIDDTFIKKLAEQGYEIKFEYVRDQEVPNSHCGRYFRLQKKVEDGNSMQSLSFQGWIGVLYNENCKRDFGDDYGQEPSFELEIRKGAIKQPNGWGGNSWGWWCCSLDCRKEWKWSSVLDDARAKILSLVEELKSLSEV